MTNLRHIITVLAQLILVMISVVIIKSQRGWPLVN